MLRLGLLLFLLFPIAAQSGTYFITTTADSGSGSLREGIERANSGECSRPCSIRLSDELPAPQSIHLRSPLPPIRAPQLSIGEAERTIDLRGDQAGGDGLRIEGTQEVRLAGLSISGFENGIALVRARSVMLEKAVLSSNGMNGLLMLHSSGLRVNQTRFGRNAGNGLFATESAVLIIHASSFGASEEGLSGNGGNGMHLHNVEFAEIRGNTFVKNIHTGLLVTGHSPNIAAEANVFFENGLLAIDRGGDGPTDEGVELLSVESNRGTLRVRTRVRAEPSALVRLFIYSVSDVDPSGRGEGLDPLPYLRAPFHGEFRAGADGVILAETYHPLPPDIGHITAQVTRIINQATRHGESSEFAANVAIQPGDIRYFVRTSADEGEGSLRRAMELANADEDCQTYFPCGIGFQMSEPPDHRGVWTIQPRRALPPIRREAVWIDGGTQRQWGDTNPHGPEVEVNGSLCAGCNGLEVRGSAQAYPNAVLIRELVINGFAGHGVLFDGGSWVARIPARIDGCFIGTDAEGLRAVPNGGSGVSVRDAEVDIGAVRDHRIPSDHPRGNLISGNGGNGITIESGRARMRGNSIGTDRSSTGPLPNGGSAIWSRGVGVAEGNVMAFNIADGVTIMAPALSVIANDIHSNGGRGIALHDVRFTLAAPQILSAEVVGGSTRIRYRLDAPRPLRPTQSYRVDFFAGSFTDTTGKGEGRRALDYTLHPGGIDQDRTITIAENLAGKFITATATPFEHDPFTPVGTVTEFSNAVQVTAGGCPTLTPLLLDPAPHTEVDGMVAFRWTTLPGANEYRIWAMRVGDMPRIVYRGSASTATISLGPGRYDWVVEARFDPCYGTQSEHRWLTVR